MEDLTKQQLILLALLVSFVTALSTGIVTVSLMNQAPEGVTKTISQVIERTVQQVIPQDAAVGKSTDSLFSHTSDAVSGVLQSVVRFQGNPSGTVSGIGLVVSKGGIIVTDKSALPQASEYQAIYPNGQSIPVAIIQSQNGGDIVFLAPLVARLASMTALSFVPATFAGSYALGDTVFSISWADSPILSQGVIAKGQASTTQSSDPIFTTISASKIAPGSPVFTASGQVLGIRTASLPGADGAEFYPGQSLKSVIPVIR